VGWCHWVGWEETERTEREELRWGSGMEASLTGVLVGDCRAHAASFCHGGALVLGGVGVVILASKDGF